MAKDLELSEIDDNSPDAPSQLRQYAQRKSTEAADAANLRREVAFLRAGVDTSTRQGQAFAATFTGDISDSAAIVADATDFNPSILRGGVPAPTEPAGEPLVAPEPTGSAQRTALADGALASGAAIADPKQSSMDTARARLAEGREQAQVIGGFIAERAAALNDGSIQPLNRDGTYGL